MEAGQTLRLDDLKITATPTVHGDPKNIGFRLEWDGFTLSLTHQTLPTLTNFIVSSKCRMLIASVIRPGNEKIRGHLCCK
jgi:hypothetical protein